VGTRIAGMDDPRRRRTFALSAGMFNYGYVTLPLTESLYPAETLGVLFVFNVGVEAAMWGVGVTLLTGGFSRSAGGNRPGARVMLGRLLSPPVIATIVAVTLNALSPPIPAAAQPVVELAGKTLGWLADAAIPIGLLLTGATIWHDWGEAKLKTGLPVVALACGVRLLLLPALFIGIAVTLPDAWASVHLRRVLVLQAAMPSAVFPIVLSRHFGGDVGTALRIVVGTSLVSLLTMPAWIALGQWLVL
ncbi:MAG: AEC family transporter, partial [Planctomycetota bacterium]